jgi:hypothetical protein
LRLKSGGPDERVSRGLDRLGLFISVGSYCLPASNARELPWISQRLERTAALLSHGRYCRAVARPSPSVPPALESRARRWAGKAAPLPGCYQRPCARNILIGTLVDISEAMASIQAIGHGLPKFQLPPVEHKKAIVTFGDRLQLN